MALKPYSGNSAERLTAMINQDNRSKLRYGVDFKYGAPEPFSGRGGRNTRVKLISLRPDRYRDEWVTYRRLGLTALDRLPEGFVQPVIIPTTPFRIHDILPQINAALGLDLSPDEVVDQTFFAAQNDYPLRIIDANSLAWYDTDFRFKAVIESPGTDIPLAFALPFTELNGLFYDNG